MNTYWVVAGDFNIVIFEKEKQGMFLEMSYGKKLFSIPEFLTWIFLLLITMDFGSQFQMGFKGITQVISNFLGLSYNIRIS